MLSVIGFKVTRAQDTKTESGPGQRDSDYGDVGGDGYTGG